MARVSRALSGVALDVLWSCIDNIFRLIDVVPSCYMYKFDDEGFYREGVVSFFIVTCGSTRKVVIVNTNTRSSSRYSLVSLTNESCFLFLSMRPRYESLGSHALMVSNMTALLNCYIGSLLTFPSYRNCTG